MNINYRHHVKHFESWRGGKTLSYKLMEDYKKYLNDTVSRKTTNRTKWAAAREVFLKEYDDTTGNKIKELFAINRRIPCSGLPRISAYHISENEYKRLLKACLSQKDAICMRLIHEFDLRAAELINLKLLDPRIYPSLQTEIKNIYGDNEYAITTRNNNQIHRVYISSRIKYWGNLILNKAITAESLRR